jgi:hypothetical protein
MRSLIFLVTAMFVSSVQADFGEPWKMHIIDDKYAGADGVHLMDIDQDGDLDAVVVWEEDAKLIVYKNPGPEDAKGRWPRTDVRGGLDVKKIEDAQFADFDRDGYVDAVVSATESHNMKVGIHWLLDRSQLFQSSSWQGTWIYPSFKYLFIKIDVGQINGFGPEDIVVGTKEKLGIPGKLLWYQAPLVLGLATTSQWRGHVIDDTGWISQVKLYDVDGDGDNDVIKGDNEGLQWYENNVAQGGPWTVHEISKKGGYFQLCPAGGLHDGMTLVSRLIGGIRILGRNVDGSWFEWHFLSQNGIPLDDGAGRAGYKGIGCGDIDQNGLYDVVVSIRGYGHGVFVLLQFPDGWQARVISSRSYNHPRKGIKHDTLTLADLDGDGDLDVITTEENAGTVDARGLGVVWFENPVR